MNLRRLKHWHIALAALAIGCASDSGTGEQNTEGVDPSAPGDDDAGTTTGVGTGTTGAPPSDGTVSPDSTQGSDAGDDGPTPEPPIDFDLGVLPDAPMLSQQCTKVDFMFVIDNSGSMGSFQANVVANFPAFINGIQNSLEDVQSYQVGVITSDEYTANKPGCQELSSLVVQTDSSGSGSVCGTGPGSTYADGYNFMTENDDLATTFSCAASVGTFGDAFERPMQAVVEAVQKVEGDPGECNEGFLRDDALLVIIVITDEADGPGDPDGTPGTGTSLGDPVSWYDDVVAAKAGIPENVVAVAMVNTPGGPCPPFGTTDNGINIATWAQMFGPNGFVGGICEPDYGPIFQEAIAVIDEACENYIPPG